MGIVSEFRQFVVRGNVLDMAVGVVIGGAFGKIVGSFVSDVIMPPLGLITGKGQDYRELAWVLGTGADGKTPAAIRYGAFAATVVDFLIVAFAIFLVVKIANAAQNIRKQADAPPPPPKTKSCPECVMEIPIGAKRCGHCTSPVPA
ncbi:MAG: large-conductance mechanosensitive channel protein MscL [Candidatus Brocadiae bacterium]|nr:large-conductance mechanosensitive channel protein MscL [Candidatus Brocadiia bacterium]